MKKIFKIGVAVTLSLAMMLGLAACGNSGSSTADEGTTTAESSGEEAATEDTTASDSSETEAATEDTTAADNAGEEAAETQEAADDSEVQDLLGETPLNPADEYFGISLPMTSSEYYKGVETELTQYCEQFGIKYDLASADSDSQKQLSQFENFMTMGCTTIIIYAQDLASMQGMMEKAEADGIRVVSATMTPPSLDAYSIAIDASQDAVGTAAAQYASDWIDANYPDAEDGSIEVALFTMSISENSIERCNGLRKIADLNPKVKVVEDYDIPIDNYLVRVKENADLMMQQHPDVKVIMTYSDAFNLVIDEAMMTNPDIDPSQICSIAIDKTTAAMEKIKLSKTNESTIRATVATGENFNLTLIQAALGAYDDQLNDLKQYFVDPFIIDADNVDTYIQ